MSFRQGQYVEFSKFKVISGKFTTFLLHWIVSSKSLSLKNLQKCFSIFSEAAPVAFLKIANPSSRDRARFFLSYFSDNLWSRKFAYFCSVKSIHCYVKQSTIFFHPRLAFVEQEWFSSVFDNSLVVCWYANVLF